MICRGVDHLHPLGFLMASALSHGFGIALARIMLRLP